MSVYNELETNSDSDEVFSLESRTTDETTVDIRACEKLLSVRRLARATIKDRNLLSELTELLGKYLADLIVDLLCLLCSCSLACTDSPNWLISYDNLSHLLSGKSIENVLHLLCNNLEMTAGLTLLELLTDTEDW